MKIPQEVFIDYLTDQNLKITPQRKIILETILNQKEHLSSEELYLKVKKKDSSVGQATVYRTLKLLVEAGIVEPLDFADGVTRYEASYGKEHHDHIICTACNRNIEILDPTIEKRQEQIAKEHGFILCSHKMYLYGICEECRNKKI